MENYRAGKGEKNGNRNEREKKIFLTGLDVKKEEGSRFWI